nr:hypothetical protein [Tanacetum cinerariifolium]
LVAGAGGAQAAQQGIQGGLVVDRDLGVGAAETQGQRAVLGHQVQGRHIMRFHFGAAVDVGLAVADSQLGRVGGVAEAVLP